MDQLEHPDERLWNERREWFEELFDIEKKGGSYLVSEHALGLLVDLQATYCAGAFTATLILACAIIDAHLSEVEGAGGGMKSAFSTSMFAEDLEWIRVRRNRLVHYKDTEPSAISVDDHWNKDIRDIHASDAMKSVELVGKVFFECPGT